VRAGHGLTNVVSAFLSLLSHNSRLSDVSHVVATETVVGSDVEDEALVAAELDILKHGVPHPSLTVCFRMEGILASRH